MLIETWDQEFILALFRGTVITSVVPGDYDGDSQMDVLLTAQSNSRISIFIFWGHNQTLGTPE